MTSPIDRLIIQCILIATAPAEIVVGVQSREVVEGDVNDAVMTSPINRLIIQCVLIATMPAELVLGVR